MAANTQIEARLSHLRDQLRAESISYGELIELQNLLPYINPDDTELLEAIGAEEPKVRGELMEVTQLSQQEFKEFYFKMGKGNQH